MTNKLQHRAASTQLQVDIVSAEGAIYSSNASMVVLPGVDGELGVLPNHSPLLSMLKPGEARITTTGGDIDYIYLSGGHVEIQPNTVIVLADTVLRSDEVDLQAALAAKAQAEKTIHTARLYLDRDMAQLELIKALAQLKVAEDARRYKKRHM